MKTVVLASMGRNGDAEKAVKQLQSRWPGWDSPYLLDGLLQERAARPVQARDKIQIALALGSLDPAARCALSRIASPTAHDTSCTCVPGIYESFFPGCSHR